MVLFLFVTRGAIEDNSFLVAALGRGHAEGAQDALGKELPIRLSADFFNNVAEQVVAGVAIDEGLPRRRSRRIYGNFVDELLRRQMMGGFKARKIIVGFEARSMGEKMLHGDAFP